jgi:acyl-CoA reductase-like NAD-dependent aldehyde dehydrogenase
MLKVLSPFDQSLIKEIPLVGSQQVETALSVAHKLFLDQSNWLPAHERITILECVVELMKARIPQLTELAASEGGKPLIDSEVEVLRAINGVKIAIESIGRLVGTQVPMGLTKASENRIAYTTKEPIGVVVSISAFNHPLNLIIHQAITAIAAGCPVVIKPALTTPLSCVAFVELLEEAGLPSGWCQSVICENDLAEQLAIDPRVNYVSFIGSAKVGWLLKSKLSPGTRCALEHGGSAPVIVEADADYDELLPALCKGGFYHAGQVCVSVQRVYVHESIVNDVANGLSGLAEKLIVGNQMNADTEVGPLILPREVDRVEEWVDEAIEQGAQLLCGGKRISDTCYEPTVLLNPAQESLVSTEEVFGPVVCVYSYSNRDKAIELANSLPCHFQASVFTKNIDIALDTVKQLNATAVMVNDHTAFRVDWMPFGGRDVSGIGMGGIEHSMQEMTREKLTVIKQGVIK